MAKSPTLDGGILKNRQILWFHWAMSSGIPARHVVLEPSVNQFGIAKKNKWKLIRSLNLIWYEPSHIFWASPIFGPKYLQHSYKTRSAVHNLCCESIGTPWTEPFPLVSGQKLVSNIWVGADVSNAMSTPDETI
jgi:hypothetical protein